MIDETYFLGIVSRVLYLCRRYVQHFGLNEPTDDIHILLSHIAKQHNLVLKTKSLTG